jgi:hypothetical protein
MAFEGELVDTLLTMYKDMLSGFDSLRRDIEDLRTQLVHLKSDHSISSAAVLTPEATATPAAVAPAAAEAAAAAIADAPGTKRRFEEVGAAAKAPSASGGGSQKKAKAARMRTHRAVSGGSVSTMSSGTTTRIFPTEEVRITPQKRYPARELEKMEEEANEMDVGADVEETHCPKSSGEKRQQGHVTGPYTRIIFCAYLFIGNHMIQSIIASRTSQRHFYAICVTNG